MRRPGLIVGIAVAILAVTLWRLTQPVPPHDLRLTELTFDAGFAGWPAISADGGKVAYASDGGGGGNLDLYVQQVPGGHPVRLTETADDESEPAFSPDGATLAYRSTRDGGGIYLMPAAGGESHLLAPGGHTPRYSPDGRWIAFSNASGAYVIASSGGTPRPFHREFPGLRTPAWSPDGRALVFWAQADLWVAPLDGGAPEPTGLAARTAQAGLGPGPFEDGTWTAAGFLFSARTGVVRNLYRCPLDSHGKAAGDAIRLTNGTELIGDAAASRDGRVVFAAGRQRFDIWGLPLDGNTGKPTGAPYRITGSLAPTANPDLSADGRKLLFGSARNGYTEVWEKDLSTGRESVAASGAEGATYGRWLKTSGRIVYARPAAAHNDVYLGDRELAAGARPWDVDTAETTLLLTGQGIDALDLRTGQRAPLIRAPPHTTLSRASFSPDGRWILFLAEAAPGSVAPAARIYVAPAAYIYAAPARDNQWLPLTDGANKVDHPRFSPGGGVIYYTLDGDGTRAIQALRFDPRAGRPLGEPFPVFQPRNPRLSLFDVNPQAQEIAVARDKLVMILCESTFTIWMGDLVPQR